jgi:hypothetical protein
MVNNEGAQLYTIEGIAAGLIMIMTAYLVVNATSVYTAGDTHISDMQLEQLGSDALNIMATPENMTAQSELQMIINTTPPNGDAFNTTFLNLVNGKAGTVNDHIQYTANYTCRTNPGDSIESHLIGYSRNMTGGEHAVRVTKWVTVKPSFSFCGTTPPPYTNRTVLAEVLIWRD